MHYSPVRHCPRFQLTEVSIHRFSFDLHVLGMPPAFVLSQDQTLNKLYLSNLSAVKIDLLKLILASKSQKNLFNVFTS